MALQSDLELRHTQERINQFQVMLKAAQTRYWDQPATLESMRSMYMDQIGDLQREIDAYLGVASTPASALELAFQSDGHADGVTRLSTLTQLADRFRKSLTHIAETLVRGGLERDQGRPKADIARAVDYRVVGIASGSFRLLLEPPAQQTIDDLGKKAIDILEDGLEWVSSGTPNPPDSLKDEKLQRLVLREIQRLSPTEASQVSWVEVRRPGAQGKAKGVAHFSVRTLRSASVRMQELMAAQSVSLVGTLRALDRDKLQFALKDKDGKRHTFFVDVSLQEDAIGYAFTQVEVIARGRKVKRRLEIYELEPSSTSAPTA